MPLNLYKSFESNGLTYTETTEVTAKVRDVLKVCLPKADARFVGLEFPSCDGPMKTVCTMKERGWLMNTENKQTVANVDELKIILKDLPGGEEALTQCLEIPEEYEEYEY